MDGYGDSYMTSDIIPRSPMVPVSGDFTKFNHITEALRINFSLSSIWLNQLQAPTPERLNTFFTGHGITGGYASAGGLSLGGIYSPGNGTATTLGIGSPGFGVSYGYGYKLGGNSSPRTDDILIMRSRQ
jgi:hypothetical protein